MDKAYTLQTADGPKTLAELFDGRSQLVVYHFMFGPDYDAGCPVCSSIADSFNGVLEHLKARDVTMICVSRAPVEKLLRRPGAAGLELPLGLELRERLQLRLRALADPGAGERLGAASAPPVVAQIAADCGTDPAGYVAERPGLSVFTLHDGERLSHLREPPPGGSSW